MRYDTTMTTEQRTSVDNGIWLCMRCGKLVDSDEEKFTLKLLHEWRDKSEWAAIRESQSGRMVIPADAIPLLEDLDGNPLQIGAAPRGEQISGFGFSGPCGGRRRYSLVQDGSGMAKPSSTANSYWSG
jgi:hypothetical protein